YAREILDQHLIGLRKPWRNPVISLLRARDHRFPLLMEERRKKKKLIVLQFESSLPLTNSSFAQDDDLLPAAQRIDDNRPFFERHPHTRNYFPCRSISAKAVSSEVNASSSSWRFNSRFKYSIASKSPW